MMAGIHMSSCHRNTRNGHHYPRSIEGIPPQLYLTHAERGNPNEVSEKKIAEQSNCKEGFIPQWEQEGSRSEGC